MAHWRVAALGVCLSIFLLCTSLVSSAHLALRSTSLSLSSGQSTEASTVSDAVRGSLLGRTRSPGRSAYGEAGVADSSSANADDASGSNSLLSDAYDEGGSESSGDDVGSGDPPLEAVSKTILRKLIVADAILTHQTLQLLTAKSHASLGKSMDDIDQVLTSLRGETARGITLTQEIAKKTAAGAQEINAIADEYLAEQQTVATMCTEALDKLAINSAVLQAASGNATGSPADAAASLESLPAVRERLVRIARMDETFKKQKQRTSSLLSKLSTQFIKLQKVAGGGPGAAASLGSLSPGAAKLILQQFGAAGAATKAIPSNSTSPNGTSSPVVASSSNSSSTSCAGLPQAVQNQTDLLGDLVAQLSVRATSIPPATTTATPAAQGKSPAGGSSGGAPSSGTAVDNSDEETPASKPHLVTEDPNDSADSSSGPGEHARVSTGSPVTVPSAVTTSSAEPPTTKSSSGTATTVALDAADKSDAGDALSKSQTSTGTVASDGNSTAATNTSSTLQADQSATDPGGGSLDDDADFLPQVDESGPIIPAKLVDVHGHTRGFAMVRATALAASAAHDIHTLRPPSAAMASLVGQSAVADTRPLATKSSAAAGSGHSNVGDGVTTPNRDDPSDAEVAAAASARTRIGFNDSWPMLPSAGWYFHNGISSS